MSQPTNAWHNHASIDHTSQSYHMPVQRHPTAKRCHTVPPLCICRLAMLTAAPAHPARCCHVLSCGFPLRPGACTACRTCASMRCRATGRRTAGRQAAACRGRPEPQADPHIAAAQPAVGPPGCAAGDGLLLPVPVRRASCSRDRRCGQPPHHAAAVCASAIVGVGRTACAGRACGADDGSGAAVRRRARHRRQQALPPGSQAPGAQGAALPDQGVSSCGPRIAVCDPQVETATL